jgi:hypothetical protein
LLLRGAASVLGCKGMIEIVFGSTYHVDGLQ